MNYSVTYPVTFRAQPLYWFIAALCVLLILLFGWQLRAGLDWGTLFFMAIALWMTVHYAQLMASRIEIDADRLRLHTPLAAPRVVEFRQISGVHETGRGLKSIVVLYHPRMDTGIVDIDAIRTLHLPAVDKHDELLAMLTAQVRS